MQQHTAEEPVVIFKDLKIESDFSSISGECILLCVTLDSSYQSLSKKIIKKQSIHLQNNYKINFHEMLKIHAENIILEYFISKGNKNYIYDYNRRSIELKVENTPNTDPGFVGNTHGIYYCMDDMMREVLYNEAAEEEEKTIGNI